ncbi:uncharacterized protein LOC127137792 [Lathyrus oleraceus]|uniref:uncharacterized protein LOC127137792 n=1 Tax=Pisum sativum TaxID=3888 RepID=UPI0021CE896D|nr:uncharacterized protein LOC127137792 [Pisum sativum]
MNVASWDALNATYIHNPATRYFHRVLGHTVFGRVNNHKVNSKELFFLHCVFTPVTFNATPFLLANIQVACMRGSTTFCFGGIITSIALGLNLGDRLANLPALPAEFLNIDYCRSSHLIKARDDRKYHPVVRNKIVRSIIMPNRNHTDPQNMANWIFDQNAPETNEGDPNNGVDEVEEELDREMPHPPLEYAAETSSQGHRRNERRPATIEYIYTEMLRHNQRMEERQTEMMQTIQQIQRDHHDYANWHDQGMVELSEEMSALTHRIDSIQEYTQHVGLDPTQRGRSEPARARARACRAQRCDDE